MLLPNAPGAIGIEFAGSYGVIDLGANDLGLILSNANAVVVGGKL